MVSPRTSSPSGWIVNANRGMSGPTAVPRTSDDQYRRVGRDTLRPGRRRGPQRRAGRRAPHTPPPGRARPHRGAGGGARGPRSRARPASGPPRPAPPSGRAGARPPRPPRRAAGPRPPGTVTSALDLTLSFVDEDHGPDLARRVAL